jgi:hypothetical protein
VLLAFKRLRRQEFAAGIRRHTLNAVIAHLADRDHADKWDGCIGKSGNTEEEIIADFTG